MRVADEGRTAPTADHAEAMGVVRHQPGIALVRRHQQFGERREVAVHGEYAVGDDQRVIVLGAMREQKLARMTDVIVPESQHAAARQLRAGIDAGVREFIQQHQPVAADQHGDNAGIGEIAGTEHDRRLGLLDLRQPRFQFGVKR